MAGAAGGGGSHGSSVDVAPCTSAGMKLSAWQTAGTFPNSCSVAGGSVVSCERYEGPNLLLPRTIRLLLPALSKPGPPAAWRGLLSTHWQSRFFPFSFGKATGWSISPSGLCTSTEAAQPQQK